MKLISKELIEIKLAFIWFRTKRYFRNLVRKALGDKNV